MVGGDKAKQGAQPLELFFAQLGHLKIVYDEQGLLAFVLLSHQLVYRRDVLQDEVWVQLIILGGILAAVDHNQLAERFGSL